MGFIKPSSGSGDGLKTISSTSILTVPLSTMNNSIGNELFINESITIDKNKRYYIGINNDKKLCGMLISGNFIFLSCIFDKFNIYIYTYRRF